MKKENGVPAEPKQIHQIVITLFDNGYVQVNGPIDDRGVCYMMMGIARDVIAQRAVKREESAGLVIAPASALQMRN